MPASTLKTTDELTAIQAAQDWAERNRITCEADWDSQPWFNRWNIYNGFKAQLAAEVWPASPEWGRASKALTEVLHV